MERKVATVNSSNLKNLLKKMGNDIAKEMAKTVSEELVEESKRVIPEFYSEYDPRYYSRWEQLTRKRIYEPYTRTKGNVAYAGVRLIADNMEEKYRASKHWVLDVAMRQGIHGVPGYGGVRVGKSTVEKLNDYVETNLQEEGLQEHFNAAYSKAVVKNRQEIDKL